jgi:hypothetical protein
MIGEVPLEHLPVDHRAREDIHLVAIFRMRVPKLRSLPVDRSYQAPNHRPCRLLHFGQSEISNLRNPSGRNQDIRRFTVSVNDGWLAEVKVFQTPSDVKHHRQLYESSCEFMFTMKANQYEQFYEGEAQQTSERNRRDRRLSTVRSLS